MKPTSSLPDRPSKGAALAASPIPIGDGSITAAASAQGLPTWPITVGFTGFVAWWLLGLAWLVWFVVALLGLCVLVNARNIRIPKRFWIYLLCIAGVLASALASDGGLNMRSYLYGSEGYLAGAVVCVYIYNTAHPALVAARCAIALCVAALACGLLGVLLPDFAYTPIGARLGSSAYFQVLSIVRFASVATVSGAPRPSGPFVYANRWGAIVGMCIPALAVYASAYWRGVRRSWLVVGGLIALIPIIYSLNRSLWVVLALGAAYFLYRALRRGHQNATLVLAVGLIVVAVVIFATPLHSIIGTKLASTESGQSRSAIYQATLAGFRQAPVFGHGTNGGVSAYQGVQLADAIGTQGQFWELLYNTGLLGTIPFYGWFFVVLWQGRRARSNLAAGLRFGIAAGLAMSYFYSLNPDGIVVLMALSAGLLYLADAESVGGPQARPLAASPIQPPLVSPGFNTPI